MSNTANFVNIIIQDNNESNVLTVEVEKEDQGGKYGEILIDGVEIEIDDFVNDSNSSGETFATSPTLSNLVNENESNNNKKQLEIGKEDKTITTSENINGATATPTASTNVSGNTGTN